MFNLYGICFGFCLILLCSALQKEVKDNGEEEKPYCKDARAYPLRIEEILGEWYLQRQEINHGEELQCVEVKIFKRKSSIYLEYSSVLESDFNSRITEKQQIFRTHNKPRLLVDLTETFSHGNSSIKMVYKVLEAKGDKFATVCSYDEENPDTVSYYLYTRERELNDSLIDPIIRATQYSFQGFKNLQSVIQSEECDGAYTTAPAIIMILASVGALRYLI